MRPVVTIDTRIYDRAVKAMISGSIEACDASIRDLAEPRVRAAAIESNQHADTGRFRRSLQQAHNDLGRGVIPLTPLRRSRAYRDWRPRLLKTAEKWERIERGYLDLVRDYEAKGRTHWKRYRELKKTLDKIGDVRDRTIENLEAIDAQGGEGAIVIGSRRRAKRKYALSNLEQVVTKVYGGRSTITREGDVTVCEMRSMEPHARLEEKRRGILRRNLSTPQSDGGAQDSYVRVMKTKGGA